MALIVCDDLAAQVEQAVASIAATLARAIDTQGEARLAVSGGRSPIALFAALADADLDWRRVTICLVDERAVPPDHADSNAALVREHLWVRRAAVARFEPLVDDPNDIDGCVRRANATAKPVTLAILGMGDDGHTASLFPDAPQTARGLDPTNPQAYLAVDPPTAPHRRISMSLAALQQAQRLVLWIQGEAKRAVYARAAASATPALPVSLLLHQQSVPVDVYWSP